MAILPEISPEQQAKDNELLDNITDSCDTDLVIQEIDNILVELIQIDNSIFQSQVGIDDLKIETREMLALLHESIV